MGIFKKFLSVVILITASLLPGLTRAAETTDNNVVRYKWWVNYRWLNGNIQWAEDPSRMGSSTYEYQAQHAFWRGLYYKSMGRSEPVADKAVQFIKGCKNYYTANPTAGNFRQGMRVAIGWWGIQGSVTERALSPADRQLVIDGITATCDASDPYNELAQHNRGMLNCAGRDVILSIMPTHPRAVQWRRDIIDPISNKIYNAPGMPESAEDYDAEYLRYLCLWWHATRQDYRWNDPRWRAVAYGYLNNFTPAGLTAGDGDTVGIMTKAACWCAIFEKWGAVYKDGRFRLMAGRIMAFMDPHHSEMTYWGNIYDYIMEDLMCALMYADTSVVACPIGVQSTVTTKRQAMPLDEYTRELSPGYGDEYELSNQNANTVPDKLVLRSGGDPNDLSLLARVSPVMGHSHYDSGAINLLVDKKNVLLSTPSYSVRDPKFHNSFVYDRAFVSAVGTFSGQITSCDLWENSYVAHAQIRVCNYMGFPADLCRRITMVKNRFVWVHDTLMMKNQGSFQAHTAVCGPAWQTYDVVSQDTDWADTKMTVIPVSYVSSDDYLAQWSNTPARHLLIKFMPKTGATKTVTDITNYSPTVRTNFKNRVWWNKSIAYTSYKQHELFSTVLVPHATTEAPTAWTSTFTAVSDTAGNKQLNFAKGSESAKLLLNTSRGSVTIDGVTTKSFLYLKTTIDGITTILEVP